MTRRFVGLGFGAIQAGLFLREVHRSNVFDHMTVAMRRPELVEAIRDGSSVAVNVAELDGRREEHYGTVSALCLNDPAQREEIVEALIRAEEISVAVSSVADYVSESASSLHRILARAMARKAAGEGPPAVIYACENNHDAAEILETAILSVAPKPARIRGVFQVVDTVIGKMSRVVTDPQEMTSAGLTRIAPGADRAFLVEAFNRILVGRIDPARTSGGRITALAERDDLAPFEDAKLHGHNATHALLAYIGLRLDLTWVSDVTALPEVRELAETAFLEESGVALCRKHRGVGALFTSSGYRTFATDLLARMSNPHLRDSCERAGRDAPRKLGWNDRLIGTIRLASAQDVPSRRYCLATLAAMDVGELDLKDLAQLWRASGAETHEITEVSGMIMSETGEYQALISRLSRAARTDANDSQTTGTIR